MLNLGQESVKGAEAEKDLYSTQVAGDSQWCERNADLVQCGGTKVIEFVASYGGICHSD